MRMIVRLDGQDYRSDVTNEATVQQVAETFYPELQNLTKFQMHLEGGGVALFPKEAIQRAVMIILPEGDSPQT